MINIDKVLGEKFHSNKMNIKDLKQLIKDFISDTHPNIAIDSIDINNDGIIDVKLHNGEEIEIEVDWNELVLG